MKPLLTDQDLADYLGLDLVDLHRRRLRYGWPCVKLGRRDIRFTPEQVDQIVRLHSVPYSPTPPNSSIPGQTPRSAARNRR